MKEMNSKMNQLDAQQTAVFTVCNIAYLPKVLVLADSVWKYNGLRLNVVVFDTKRELPSCCEKLNIIWLEELGVPEWKSLAFTYDIIEFSTSLKPWIARKLLEKYSNVIFLDPDTAIYGSLNPILNDLASSSVVLTPHYTKPQPSTAGESDLAMMRFGSFNLGFFAVRQSEESLEFLDWWCQRCFDFCYMESQFGLSTDQKWISIAPCFFQNMNISFNKGYNAAPWNTFERELTTKKDGTYFFEDGTPLVFFHFSNFDHADPQYLQKRASNEVGRKYDILEELGSDYSKLLRQYEEIIGRPPYSFDYMSDGSYISPTLRRAYASVRGNLAPGIDPFDATGTVGVFAKKNALVSRKGQQRYNYPSLKEAQNHSAMLSLIYGLMRLLLRIVGPNRFYDISKLMVFLSIYRKNHRYWKL